LGTLLRHVHRHVVGYIALFVALGGVAYAAIPDSGGVIHGCYQKAPGAGGLPKGALRVIDPGANESCSSGESALDWNATGPSGPQGPQGQQGPEGPQGTGVTFEPPSGRGNLPPWATKVSQTLNGTFPGPLEADYTVKVRCTQKFPVALTGGWRLNGGGLDGVHGPGAYPSGATQVYELYSDRINIFRRGQPEGWAASVTSTGFPTSRADSMTVWAVCATKRRAANALGVHLVPGPH
jgi:hypothetical protein